MKLFRYAPGTLFFHSCRAFSNIIPGRSGTDVDHNTRMNNNIPIIPPESVIPKLSKIHHDAARLCRDVYDDEYLLSCEGFVDDKETDCQVSLTKEGSTIFVCFRGSDSKQDWKLNFKSSFTEFPIYSGRKVHTGFLMQWLSVKEKVIFQLLHMLQKYEGQIDKITFTGHSLGSNSMLALLSIFENRAQHSIEGIEMDGITFGGPRIGNKKFKEAFESKISCTRIVLDRDLVTRVPFWSNYRHIGNPIQIRENEIINRDTSTWETITWLLKGIVLERDFGVKDHDINRYYKEIGEIVYNNDSE